MKFNYKKVKGGIHEISCNKIIFDGNMVFVYSRDVQVHHVEFDKIEWFDIKN